jgi:hypothetical protein
VNRKPLIAALGCALLATSLLGCGGSNRLQSINLTIGGQAGTFNLQGIGGTLQLKAIGNYSNSKTKDLTNVVVYTVVPDGNDVLGRPLNAPPMSVTISPTGLMTAVDPAVCTWENLQQDDTKPAAWALTGSYKVTVSFQGITSQPVFVAMASATGLGPPAGACGPTS